MHLNQNAVPIALNNYFEIEAECTERQFALELNYINYPIKTWELRFRTVTKLCRNENEICKV